MVDARTFGSFWHDIFIDLRLSFNKSCIRVGRCSQCTASHGLQRRCTAAFSHSVTAGEAPYSKGDRVRQDESA